MTKSTNKSLEKLLGKWEIEIPRESYSSSIQLRAYNLYTRKISDFEIDDIRFMIVQRIGLEFLVPRALDFLKNNILVKTNYYEGDLLHGVLITPALFWKSNHKLHSQFYEILLKNKDVLSGLNPYYEAERKLIQDYNQFLQVLI
jgi:CDI immunity proteins